VSNTGEVLKQFGSSELSVGIKLAFNICR